MNTRVQMLLVAALILTSVIQETSANRKMSFSFRRGACSAQLMDMLRKMCGSAGVKLVRNIYLVQRYRSRHLKQRRHQFRRSRSGRSIEDLEEFHYLSFLQAREQESSNASLSSIISTGKKIHHERKEKTRVRRQIAHECCMNDCDPIAVRNTYCRFNYK